MIISYLGFCVFVCFLEFQFKVECWKNVIRRCHGGGGGVDSQPLLLESLLLERLKRLYVFIATIAVALRTISPLLRSTLLHLQ